MKNRQLMVKTLGILTATALAVILVAGCAKKENPVVGRWDDGHKGVVTFKEDNTFSVGTGANTAAGKWTLTDKKVAINIETVGGKPAEDKMKEIIDQVAKMNPKNNAKDMMAKMKESLKINLTISEDGKTMTAEAKNGMPAAKFNKLEGNAQPAEPATPSMGAAPHGGPGAGAPPAPAPTK